MDATVLMKEMMVVGEEDGLQVEGPFMATVGGRATRATCVQIARVTLIMMMFLIFPTRSTTTIAPWAYK